MTKGRTSRPRIAPPETVAEEFLYHLFRGSELLSDGAYEGAREELARALDAQPRDPAAQDLLAKVYFKLGLYPRSIELYQDIVRQFPERIPPRINLALAYLKTGQMRDAVDHLLPVIERNADHPRAWGYLGLAWSRLGEYAKAREAFVRAGHDGMARRMEEALDAQYAPQARASVVPPGANDSVGAAAVRPVDVRFPAAAEVPHSASESWMPPGVETNEPEHVAPRETFAEFAHASALAPRGGVIELDGGALVVVGGCAVRIGAGAVESGLERGERVSRRTRDALPFAGAPEMVWLRSGWVAIPPSAHGSRAIVTLRDEALAVCEEIVTAFEGALLYENGSIDAAGVRLPIVTFRGRGKLALMCDRALRTIQVTTGAALSVPIADYAGQSIGISLSSSASGARFECRGDGHVLVKVPREAGALS